MPKQSKKEGKRGFPLYTTAQSNAYKQQVIKQGKTLLAGSNLQLERLQQENPDPSYLSIFKKDYKGLKQTHPVDELEVNQYTYDQKAKRDRHFNMKKQADTKQRMVFPTTSSQQYGWKQPIDTFPTHFGMKSTFEQSLSVQNKKTQKK